MKIGYESGKKEIQKSSEGVDTSVSSTSLRQAPVRAASTERTLVAEQDAQVAKIIPRWAGDHHVTECFEEWKSVEVSQVFGRVQSNRLRFLPG